jgi:hypothetical protein
MLFEVRATFNRLPATGGEADLVITEPGAVELIYRSLSVATVLKRTHNGRSIVRCHAYLASLNYCALVS